VRERVEANVLAQLADTSSKTLCRPTYCGGISFDELRNYLLRFTVQ